MRKWRKSLAVILAFLMVVSTPVMALADQSEEVTVAVIEEDEVNNVEEEDTVIQEATVSQEEDSIEIKAEDKNDDINKEQSDAEPVEETLEENEPEEETLGASDNVFYWGIDDEGTLHISSRDTGIENGDYFYDEKYVTLPWKQSQEKIYKVVIDDVIKPENPNSWFSNLLNVKEMDLSNLDTSNVTSMSRMFSNCESLTELDLSSFDTGNVTSMSSMFSNCESLTELDLSSFDTGNVTDMCYMFFDCKSLTELDVSGFDTSNVIYMYDMFYYCDSLVTIDVSRWDTSNVTSMTSMFTNCESLTELDLSSFDTSNATDKSYMFSGCSRLSRITLDTDMIYVEDLPIPLSPIIPGADGLWYDEKTGIGYMVDEIPKGVIITLVAVPQKEPARDQGGFIYIGIDNENTLHFSSEKTDYDIVGCFDKRINISVRDLVGEELSLKIKKIVFDDEIKPLHMRGWFDLLHNVEKIDTYNLNTSMVDDMSFLFNNCTSLYSLDVSNFDTSNVTGMRFMFSSCEALTSLNVSNFDTSNVTDMSSMFDSCEALTSLNVSNFDTSNVTDMSSMFSSCEALTSLNVSNFDTSKVTRMSGMFRNCKQLTNLDLSNFNSSSVFWMSSMFSGCSNLEKIDISNIDTSGLYVSDNKAISGGTANVFSGCNHLAEIKVGTGWTGNVTLPTPSAEYILEADGKWYNKETKLGYSPDNIPTGVAATYVAVLSVEHPVEQTYTITWKNWDGTVLETDTNVAAGTTPTYDGATPTKPSDAQYSYTFAGWDKAIAAVTGDVTYTAQFNAVVQRYTVTWKNWNGSILETDEDVAYGATPTYNGATPTKPSDAQYSYAFAGWDKAITAVTGDVTYTAVFTQTAKRYKVTFDANGHGTSPAAITVSVGQKIIKPADPSASSYAFGGWYKEAACTNEWKFDTELMPGKDITLYAKWTYSGSTTGGGGTSSGGSGGGGGGSSSGGSGGGGSAGGPGAKSTAVAGAPTFSKNWVADAAGVWRIRDKGGNYVTSAWLCDDAVTTNGQSVWYLMNTDGTMLAAGLVQDNTGNYYSLEMNHNGYYGMLRYKNGTYDGIYMEFSQKHDGTFGAITNQSAIDALKAKYGVTKFGIGNDRCVYTKSFE